MKIAIYGYGNLGRGVELAVRQNPDMELTAVFTRRPANQIKLQTENVRVLPANEILKHKDLVDVLIICGGSATDLPEMTPMLASDFNVIDSFDTHAKIPEHFENVDNASKKSGHISMISCGWDPGLFSLNRLYASAILPNGNDYTFWGRGVSQGHSDAIRRIDGVLDARQYTVPIESSVNAVKEGKAPTLTTREKHKRECYVVAKEGADLQKIENEIKSMPNYFADYDTTVTFISADEMEKNHSELPHGGSVIRSGKVGKDGKHTCVIEYNLKLDSNPEFTASVLVAYARALYKMNNKGVTGCKTVFDIAPADLSLLSSEELRKKML